MNKLPEKLTLLRKHYGYSQGDIASKLHIPVTEYMNWENGNKICTIQQLKQVSDLFHVSLDAMADNTKEIVIAQDNLGDSVNIPFLGEAAQTSMTQQMDVADNMIPVSGVLPPNTQQHTLEVSTVDTASLAQTKQIETQPQPVKAKPVTPVKKEDPKAKKKKTTMIVAGVCCAAVVIVGLIIFLLTRGGTSTSVSLSTVNRLAVGDTYSLYIDKNGSLQTYGTFNSASSFKDTVQVSAYGMHAVGLKKDGTVVTTDGADVSDWNNVTMIAAGKNHTVGLKNDGTVLCTGDVNACAVDDWTNIKSVYAGNNVTVAVTTEGALKVSGSVNSSIANQTGVLSVKMTDALLSIVKTNQTVATYAIGSTAAISTASWNGVTDVAIGNDTIIGLKSDGTVTVATSATDKEDMQKTIEGWKNIRYIAAYNNTYVAIDQSGAIYGAGDNSNGQYGVSNATPTPEAKSLETPKNIKAEVTTANLSIKWDTVEHADYYEVTITGMDKIKAASNSTSIAVSKLTEGTEYTITVVAHSDKPEDYPDSESGTIMYTYTPITTPLAGPTNIVGTSELNAWTISWDAVENADYYILNLDGGPDQKTETNRITIGTDNTHITDNTTHNIQVVAYSDSTAFTQSEPEKTTLKYSLTKYSIKISFKSIDPDDTFTEAANEGKALTLAAGTYKVSQFFPTTNTEYRLVDTEETFVAQADGTLEFKITKLQEGNGE